jgi:hypothetical protein
MNEQYFEARRQFVFPQGRAASFAALVIVHSLCR